MSFVATAPTATPPAPADSIVANDGFFPDVDLSKLREQMRLDGTVTHARLLAATVLAMIAVNDELEAWKATKVAAGTAQLADMPPSIGGASVQVHRYLTAVYRMTKADLTERYRDYDATNSGEDKAQQLESTVDDDRRAARFAIRDILGLSRLVAELI